MVAGPMSASQIFAGLALIVGLAVACQVIAARFGIPAIILLLPAGFAAGALTTVVNPDKIFGAAAAVTATHHQWPPSQCGLESTFHFSPWLITPRNTRPAKPPKTPSAAAYPIRGQNPAD